MHRVLPPAIARLQRHISQVYFFSGAERSLPETTQLLPLVNEAWEKAAAAFGWDRDISAAGPGPACSLSMPVVPTALVRVSRPALVMCLFEIFINAMEASPPGAEILATFNQNQHFRIAVGVHDRGTPITDEVAARAGEAFFTTKSSGLGASASASAWSRRSFGSTTAPFTSAPPRGPGAPRAASSCPSSSNPGSRPNP
jgi:signal transduction histidine kinase